MVLYCKLDQKVWGVEDYTNEDALGITGTIYSDSALTTAFDLTGYTLSFRLISQGELVFDDDDDISIVTAGSGTWKLNPREGALLFETHGEVIIRLEKSGTEVSAIGINGSSDLHIQLV